MTDSSRRCRVTPNAGDQRTYHESEQANRMDITVWVKPGSRKGPLVVVEPSADPGHRLTVFVRERAIDGHANTAVLHALANHYGIPKSALRVLHGHTSRLKRIRIDHPETTEAR